MRTVLEAAAPDIAKGVRAAVVMVVPFYLAGTLHRPELSWTALGGWLGTLADPGGSRTTRAKTLLAFALAGAALVAGVESLVARRHVATLGFTAVVFAMSLLRARGGTAGTIGSLLTVVCAIASARPRTTPAHDAAFFALGALTAVVLSSVVWPVWTHLPVRRAVAAVYRELAAYIADAKEAIAARAPPGDERWHALVREHHRRVRAAIESARALALAVRARREGETRYGGNVRVLLGVGEAQFPLLATLIQELEALPPDARAEPARRLQPIAANDREVERVLVARSIRSRTPEPRAQRPMEPHDAASVTQSLWARLEAMSRDAAALVHAIDEPSTDAGPPSEAPVEPRPGLAERARAELSALRDALSPRSIFFLYAVRVSAAGLVASFVGAELSPAHAYWVTLTTLVVLQPNPGATMKMTGERVLGTVLGSVVAVAITETVTDPLALSAVMVPLSVAAVATKPRSYRLFTFFLTPVFVLVAERHPGDWWTAAERAGDAVLGGIVALVAGVLILPSSEQKRLPDALAAMVDAAAAYAELVLGGGAADRIAAARRAAGLAFGAAETTLERYMAEPRRDEARATNAMLLVTYTRRLVTALTSLHTLAAAAPASVNDRDVVAVAAYVAGVLRGDAARPAPVVGWDLGAPAGAALERVVRWAALLAAGLEKEKGGPDRARPPMLPTLG
ncbi:MAG TPA: FUSC family protein [Haliangiales bacterium]|nr:FUSC family protein [Haliangiales bacterium]